MKKKFIAILAVLLVVGTVNVFALTGIGVQGGYSVSGAGGGAITFKVSSFPAVFAASACFGGYTAFGVTADWWAANPAIKGDWHWYYAFGLAAEFGTTSAWTGIGIGPRVVIGMNYFLLKNKALELYVQAAYQPELWIYFGDASGIHFDWINIPFNLGFRYWF